MWKKKSVATDQLSEIDCPPLITCKIKQLNAAKKCSGNRAQRKPPSRWITAKLKPGNQKGHAGLGRYAGQCCRWRRSWGAQQAGRAIRARPACALAVMSWPILPGMEHLVAVGSQVSEAEHHTIGFSWGGTWAVLGLMVPELMICLSLVPVV